MSSRTRRTASRAKSAGSPASATSRTRPRREAAIAKAREAHGPARIVIQCAGHRAAGEDRRQEGPHALDLYTKVIGVNLIGIFNVMRLAAADMLGLEPLATGERGVIINTASIAAFEGQVGQAAYASSKAGVIGLTLPAAREFASSHIRVVCIAPGIFKTPMMAGLPEETQRRWALRYRSRRGWVIRANSPSWRCRSSTIPISTATSSASTAHCACRLDVSNARHRHHRPLAAAPGGRP